MSRYNSLLDTDVCYDTSGIPYIPAKRIRGCLRECALELVDWGADINVSALFGEKGHAESAALVRIGNAYLYGYEELRNLVVEYKNNVVMHPQNVLSSFTYTRTQTSIDRETGVSKDNSLRTMRVIDKGLRFVADVEVDEDQYSNLAECCIALRHMGIARTRGFGEVKVRLTDLQNPAPEQNRHVSFQDGATRLHYEIELQEPMICKSLNGEEGNTLDYIEGSKVLGMICQLLPDDYFAFMEKGKLCCSNAYISRKGIRYTEAPAYLFTIKNNKENIVNKLYEKTAEPSVRERWDKEQKNQIKHCYYHIDGNRISFENVVTEKRYHHRRPDDKSIGRAVSGMDNDSDFYQMDSIAQQQRFAGFVEGSAEQIKEVYELLVSAGKQYMGYARTSEYGKVKIRITGMDLSGREGNIRSRKFAVSLISPAIIYSEKAMVSTDPMELRKEILAALKLTQEVEEVTNYLRYTSVGGYNTTWGKRKPTLAAFDKGTSLFFEFTSEVELPAEQSLWIGERTSEGYGECRLEIIPESEDKYILDVIKEDAEAGKAEFIVDDALKEKLCEPLLDGFIRDHAREKAEQWVKGTKIHKDVIRPTVSNMLLMVKENKTLSAVEETVKERYEKNSRVKKEKMETAKSIIEDVQDGLKSILVHFESRYAIKGVKTSEESLKMKYLNAYLVQVKYMLRDAKGEKSNG